MTASKTAVATLLVVWTMLWVCGCGPSAPAEPRLVQTIEGFHRPESCAFGLDGRTLFVSNVASGVYGPQENFLLVAGEGFLTKLAVDGDGRARLVDEDYVTHLNAPLGVTVLPVATERFPAGTLFVNVGFWLQGSPQGRYVTDPAELGTGITAVDPRTGAILAHIPCGEGSAVAEALGFACYGLNGACFDREGNFYAAESGAARTTEPPRQGRAGVLKIAHGALDALAAGESAEGVAFEPVPWGANGVGYRDEDDSIYWATSGDGDDPRYTGVFRMPRRRFGRGGQAETVASGLGKLDGIVFTPAGTIIVSRQQGDLATIDPDTGHWAPLELGVTFKSPSDIKLQPLPDGASLLAVPEQEPGGEFYSQRVRLIHLPAGF